MITVLAGGVGAARLLSGMVNALDESEITAIGNTGDDLELHGLHISPDLDTVTYTLAGRVSQQTGWGLEDETWAVMEGLERFGVEPWFRLGDRDLATHLYRTGRLLSGSTLAEVTADITASFGLSLRLIPMTNDRLRTRLVLSDGREVDFQEYFVRLRQKPAVRAVHFVGHEGAQPAPGVLGAIAESEVIVIAPSNPILSIAPILSVPGIADALVARRDAVVAVSPIVGGVALKGPADHLLAELGHDSSASGVAAIYAPYARTFVIDTVDTALVAPIEELDMRAVVTDTVMRDPKVAKALALVAIDAARAGGRN